MSNEKEPDWEQVFKIFIEATAKMRRGSLKYGEYDPATCTRDLLTEAQDEILDAINYLAMHYLKLDEMRRKMTACVADQ